MPTGLFPWVCESCKTPTYESYVSLSLIANSAGPALV